MDVRLGFDFGVEVGLGNGVHLAGVIVGVHVGDHGGGGDDAIGGIGSTGVGYGGVGVVVGHGGSVIATGIGSTGVGHSGGVAGISSAGGDDAGVSGSDERENSDKSLHVEYELLLVLQDTTECL